MRIGLTKYGLPQVVVLPVVMLWLMALAGLVVGGWVFWAIEGVLVVVLLWVLAFFRDPGRIVPEGDDILVSPADGCVTDIDTVDENSVIGGKALRIGIFLSIFDVHINRMPCAAKVEKITYKKGVYKNAMNPDSARVNESNDVAIVRLSEPFDKLLVRQVSGAIARRIVCCAKAGEDFAGGERFGMIKFGSRTELYLPVRDNTKCVVKKCDKVKAGQTILVRYSN